MKILLVSSYLPYPLYSGGHVRLFNIIKRLSKNHQITLVCEKREYQNDSDIKELKKICKEVHVVKRKKQWSVQNVLESASIFPFLLVGHTNGKMKTIIENLLQKNTYDVIHVETFYVLQNVPKTTMPIVLTEHNIEYLVYKRFVATAPLFLRPLLLIDIVKLKYFEKLFWKRATKLIAVSEVEKDIMASGAIVVPNGVDLAVFKEKNGKVNEGNKILFIGDFKWIQNKDTVSWIIKEIFPLIEKQLNATLWILGRNMTPTLKAMLKKKNIIVEENSSRDTASIFREADVLLSPIRVGGGTSFKILEAMASGVPVITTPLGVEGITASDSAILTGKTSEEIAEKVVEVLKNAALYQKVAKNARKIIEQKYNWDSIVKSLEDVYESVKK